MKKFFLLILIISCNQAFTDTQKQLYFSTASDEKYFNLLLNLIGSIHKTNYKNLEEIAVFNLGMTKEQIQYLKTIEKVTVNEVEKTHPDILKQFVTNNYGKTVPGWYAWKPVIMKQVLEKFPYCLWIDAGACILKPIDHLFKYIQQNGYFIHTIGTTRNQDGSFVNTVESQTTRYLLNKFDIKHISRNWILKEEPINCSFWGASRSALNSLVLPFYEFAKDLRNFEDDGTAPKGFGASRHDQAVLTLIGYTKGFKIQRMDFTQKTPMFLTVDKQEIPFYMTWNPEYLSEKTDVYNTRFDNRYNNFFKQFIKYKNKSTSQQNYKSDLIVFSFNRPMQLYAFLESVEKYITNIGQVNIIYKVSDEKFEHAYEEVKKRFNSYIFHKQLTENPYKLNDFKFLTLKLIFLQKSEFIIFSVDDIIVKDQIDISKCIEALNLTDAYAFYLRLGMNITKSFNESKIDVPENTLVKDDIYSYKIKDLFRNGENDWYYPNTLDMAIYSKEKIKNDLFNIEMTNPNLFEFNWIWTHQLDANDIGLFFKESKIINIPINVCNSWPNNKNMGLHSTQELLEKFNKGFKINIDKYYKINNDSAHMEYIPEFIKR